MRRTKRRRRRARKIVRLLQTLIIFVLVLGLCGLVGWLMWDNAGEEETVSYPMDYEDLIRQYAEENDLEPAYVAAVIMAESSFQADALSSADAQGLMQILPSTAEWIAGKLDETYVEGCLYDPETNIRYGCWYLGFLMDRYDGDMVCASSAYHQGQGTVDDWLEDPELSSDGETLDAFGSTATETYVNRILKYYEVYKEQYAD